MTLRRTVLARHKGLEWFCAGVVFGAVVIALLAALS
jgi:hypothetical protein